MMTHDPSNRKSPRYSCNFNGRLSVICPEETFSPVPFPVQVKDISESGCRMLTRSVTRDMYTNFMKAVRPAKVEIELPDRRVLLLRSKLVWMDFQQKTHTVLAITFNPLEEQAHQELVTLLHELNRSGAILLAATNRPDPSTASDVVKSTRQVVTQSS